MSFVRNVHSALSLFTLCNDTKLRRSGDKRVSALFVVFVRVHAVTVSAFAQRRPCSRCLYEHVLERSSIPSIAMLI